MSDYDQSQILTFNSGASNVITNIPDKELMEAAFESWKQRKICAYVSNDGDVVTIDNYRVLDLVKDKPFFNRVRTLQLLKGEFTPYEMTTLKSNVANRQYISKNVTNMPKTKDGDKPILTDAQIEDIERAAAGLAPKSKAKGKANRKESLLDSGADYNAMDLTAPQVSTAVDVISSI